MPHSSQAGSCSLPKGVMITQAVGCRPEGQGCCRKPGAAQVPNHLAPAAHPKAN